MHYGIGIGSKTSTGGEVTEGNSSVIFDGMVASSIGHMATCTACSKGRCEQVPDVRS
ncbi:PAAR domain-containing protein [Aeromonas veronii]|uniref:PAAR domain-containing protein n=1 Tax=Aeromonas veronii TaxID=654 RepID=UPI00113261F8